MAPFHAIFQINTPNGDNKAFFVNMTCSESQQRDWMKTTWYLDDSVETMVADFIVNRTKAITKGRDGADSKNGFYKILNGLYGPITDNKLTVELILRNNKHTLLENAVVPLFFENGEIEFEKIHLNGQYTANLLTGKGNQLFLSTKGV